MEIIPSFGSIIALLFFTNLIASRNVILWNCIKYDMQTLEDRDFPAKLYKYILYIIIIYIYIIYQ